MRNKAAHLHYHFKSMVSREISSVASVTGKTESKLASTKRSFYPKRIHQVSGWRLSGGLPGTEGRTSI